MYRFIRTAGFSVLLLAAAGAARGQSTEVPATVAPGHFLLEMDALALSVDRAPGAKSTAFAAASTLLTTGLTTNLDLQVGAEMFVSQKIETSGFTERNSGLGDVYVRTKWRFYDEGGTAMAVLPFVKIPTSTNGVGNEAVEGGIIVPCSVQLPTGFEFAAMVEVDFLRNAADDGYDASWYGSAYLHRPLTRFLGVYGEVTMGKSSGDGVFLGAMGAGATLAMNDRTWWDYALYQGISSGAADWNHVLRFNLRF